MDRVCDDHNPIIVTRRNERSVVMISIEDYEALVETSYYFEAQRTDRGSWRRRRN
jgi:antitoxin YefM